MPKGKVNVGNEVTFSQLNDTQKLDVIRKHLKGDILNSVQILSVVYRSPEMLESLAQLLLVEANKANKVAEDEVSG